MVLGETSLALDHNGFVFIASVVHLRGSLVTFLLIPLFGISSVFGIYLYLLLVLLKLVLIALFRSTRIVFGSNVVGYCFSRHVGIHFSILGIESKVFFVFGPFGIIGSGSCLGASIGCLIKRSVALGHCSHLILGLSLSCHCSHLSLVVALVWNGSFLSSGLALCRDGADLSLHKGCGVNIDGFLFDIGDFASDQIRRFLGGFVLGLYLLGLWQSFGQRKAGIDFCLILGSFFELDAHVRRNGVIVLPFDVMVSFLVLLSALVFIIIDPDHLLVHGVDVNGFGLGL